MGRRHITKPFNILNGVDISGDAESAYSDVSNYDNVLYLIDWSGDAIGVLSVVVANQEGEEEHELDFGQTIPVNTSEGYKHQIVINTIAHRLMKLKYVSSSGTGTLNATISMTNKGA